MTTEGVQALPLHGLTAVVQFVTRQFLDDRHYSQLHAVLSSKWDSYQSLTAAMKLMDQYGVVLSPEEEQRLLAMEEAQMIDHLVSRMPQQTKEQFEHFFLQLQLIVSTATRVRQGLEDGTPKIIEEALKDADETGIMPYILKIGIVQAGAEVIELRRQHDFWCKEADARMLDLLRGQDDALQAKKQLAAAQAQLFQYSAGHKDKAKKALMGIVGKNDKALIANVFGEWRSVKERIAKEKEIRKEYEERIEAAQKRLFDYKQAQKSNAKGVLLRQAASGEGGLIAEVFGYLVKPLHDRKADEEAAAKLAEIEAKLAAQMSKGKENAKAVLMRNLASSDSQLCDVCIEAWKKWLEEYKKDKESEDAVKRQEQQIAAFMKSKSEGAKGIIDRMNSATDSGLVEHVISTWVQYQKDKKKAEEMNAIINGAENKFASFAARNKAGANSAGAKATEVRDYGIIIHAFLLWADIAKVERMMRYYQTRMEGKKSQLSSLQSMFRNFASQLESGLKDGTPRDQMALKGGKPPSGRKPGLSKSGQTCSLPDIHQKQPVQVGSHRSGRL